MGKLFRKIIDAVEHDRVVVSDHADDRLRERRIKMWQIVSGVEDGKLLRERSRARPFPSVEVEQVLDRWNPRQDGLVVGRGAFSSPAGNRAYS